MSSMHRTIEGNVLVRHLVRDELLINQHLVARHGRSGRTLVKEGPLRVTLMALDADGSLPTHSTTGPVTVHMLEGTIEFHALGLSYLLQAGDLLALAPGVLHGATSLTGGLFLLTVVHDPSGGSRAASDAAAAPRPV